MLNSSEFPSMRAALKKITSLKCCFALYNVIIKYNASAGFAISNTLNLTLLQYFLKELVMKGTNS